MLSYNYSFILFIVVLRRLCFYQSWFVCVFLSVCQQDYSELQMEIGDNSCVGGWGIEGGTRNNPLFRQPSVEYRPLQMPNNIITCLVIKLSEGCQT